MGRPVGSGLPLPGLGHTAAQRVNETSRTMRVDTVPWTFWSGSLEMASCHLLLGASGMLNSTPLSAAFSSSANASAVNGRIIWLTSVALFGAWAAVDDAALCSSLASRLEM